MATTGMARGVAAAWTRARSRYPLLDHLVRAGIRFHAADGEEP